MTNSFFLRDATNSKNKAGVNKLNSVQCATELRDIEPIGTPNRVTLFSGYLGLTGVSTTRVNQVGVGSLAAPISYYIGAHNDYDINIQKIIYLATWNKKNSEWADLVAPLINGYQINAIETGVSTSFANALTMGDMFVNFGQGSKSGELKAFNGISDAAIMEMQVNELIPGGLRLARDSKDRLEVLLQDDHSLIVEQFVWVLGHKHHPA